MRNPKPRHFTDEQEREMEATERVLFRARIYERGVAEALKSEYVSDAEYAVISQVLAEAVDLHRHANQIREKVKATAANSIQLRRNHVRISSKKGKA